MTSAVSPKTRLLPSQKNDPRITKALKKILRSDQWSLLQRDRIAYGRDCNSKSIMWARAGRIEYPPQCLVWPETTQQLAKVLEVAQDLVIPVIPFGGGSGVCGGTWAMRGGICLDLKRMDEILAWDTRNMEVRVQSGINGEVFERALNRRGLTLGHFPSSIYAATVGGYLACRSAGQFSSLYGKIEDMVRGMEVVLADGSIVEIDAVDQAPQTLDLKEIFLGCEGTLGVITESRLKVHGLPESQSYLGFQFNNLEKATQASREVLQAGLRPAVLRIYDPLDSFLAGSYKDGKGKNFFNQTLKKVLQPALRFVKDRSLKVALKNSKLLKNLTDFLPSQVLMILGFHGPASLVLNHLGQAEKICRSHNGKNLGPGPGEHWLKHRYSVSYKLSPLFDEGFFADTLETATTWKNLHGLYHRVRDAIGKHALVLAHFSHAYPEGCSIYFTFVGYRESEAESRQLYDCIWKDGLDAVVQAGGTISHHHGIGFLKADYMKREWGGAFEGLCRIKRELDPKNILNPGKLGFPLDW